MREDTYETNSQHVMGMTSLNKNRRGYEHLDLPKSSRAKKGWKLENWTKDETQNIKTNVQILLL